MQLPKCVKAGAALLALAVGLAATAARAGDVLAEISVRNVQRPTTVHGEMFVFPENVRHYSPASFYGWSFRHNLRDGGVRELEVVRARTRGAYLMATDLFPDGHFSTMSHTVLMVFPRSPVGRSELYALQEDGGGNLRLLAPDGSTLLVDSVDGTVLTTDDFSLAPQGVPGTPPGLWHRGLHLEIHAVGKSPFLRRTPVVIRDATGRSCSVQSDEVFAFGKGPESDVFRFDSDAQFFRFLAVRCPELRMPSSDWRAGSGLTSASSDGAVPILIPAVDAPSGGVMDSERKPWSTRGGVFAFFSRLFSN